MDGLNKVIRILNKVGVFSRWTNVIGIAIFFLMICVTFIDVIMRYVFNRPIYGVVEVTEVMMITAVFLAVAHTQNEKGHVSVDLITARLAPKSRTVMEFITTLLGLGTFVIIIWRVLVQTIRFANVNATHSQNLLIPSAPFSAIIVFGCTMLGLLLLRDLLQTLTEGLKQGLTRYHWLLMVGILILFLVLAIFWIQPELWQLTLPTVGLIGVIVSLILFLMGMPISFALLLTSLIFIGHIRGLETALNIIGTETYRTVGTYTWSVLPFFVILGFFCLYARFGEDLYYAAYRWFGHWRGGMAVATIGACTGFAAIVGDPISATATMGAAALPQMKKYHYDDHLSTGSIVGGATLGPIIPPSVAFILYGFLTQLSIGTLFVAGIFPGLVMAGCFVFIIYIWCRLYPKAGPPGERSAWGPRFVSLKASGPVIVLFLLVVGGIYRGVFTPTEGGAIGAVVAFLLGLVMRRFSWKRFIQALLDAGKTVSMVFLILIGAMIFTRFLAWCNLSGSIITLINGLNLSPSVFVLVTIIVFIILGCFVDLMPLLLIGVPIVHPVAISMGINQVWFAVLVVLAINLGALTPPVGINLFVLKGLNREIPMGTIYKGALPFVLGTIVAIGIVFALPSLATWLPTALK